MDRIGKVIIAAKAKISLQIYTIKTFFEKNCYQTDLLKKS